MNVAGKDVSKYSTMCCMQKCVVKQLQNYVEQMKGKSIQSQELHVLARGYVRLHRESRNESWQ